MVVANFLLRCHWSSCLLHGLQKLLAAESEVNIMKEELIQLQPKLIATGKQVGCCLNISVRMLKC